jgi:uncharacterized protein (DUF58 family)
VSSYLGIFVIVISLLGLIGVFSGFYVIFFIAVLVLLTLLFSRSWNKHVFDKLIVRRYFSKEKAEPGEELEYVVELENRKFLPIIAMKMASTVSPDLKYISERIIFERSRLNVRLRDIFSLRWYERVKRRYRVIPQKRGLLGVFSINLEYFDPFGFFENHMEDGESVKLYVYPRILPVITQEIDYSMLFGTRAHQGWIFQDRLNKVGIRPYQVTDNFKEINWKASARTLELQSDICKPSLNQEVHIFQGLKTRDRWWDKDNTNLLELSLVCAASLCDSFFRKHFKVGFYSSLYSVNQSLDNYTAIEVSPNREQRELILTALTLLKGNSKIALSRILEMESKKINSGATLIIIIDEVDDQLRLVLNHLKRKFRVILISIVSSEEQKPGHLNISGVQQLFLKEGDWNGIEKIELYH